MSVGERIRKRRKELKYSADYVAKMLDKNRATVYRYESNEIEDMSINVIGEIAEVLDVDPSYLMGWDGLDELVSPSRMYNYYPTAISAGLPLEVDAVTNNNLKQISLPDDLLGKYAGNKNLFFVKANGDSMDNLFGDGSLLAIKPITLDELKDGDIVIYRNNYEYSVKHIYIQDDKVLFRPNSKNHMHTDSVVTDTSNLNIEGKVVSYTVKLD